VTNATAGLGTRWHESSTGLTVLTLVCALAVFKHAAQTQSMPWSGVFSGGGHMTNNVKVTGLLARPADLKNTATNGSGLRVVSPRPAIPTNLDYTIALAKEGQGNLASKSCGTTHYARLGDPGKQPIPKSLEVASRTLNWSPAVFEYTRDTIERVAMTA